MNEQTTTAGSLMLRSVSKTSARRFVFSRPSAEFSIRHVTARPATGGRSGNMQRMVVSVKPSVRARTLNVSIALVTVAAS
jgi:hypothetical protein